MKSILVILLGIIAILVVIGGAVAFNVVNEISSGDVSSDTLDKMMDKINSVTSSQPDVKTASSDAGSGSQDSGDSNVVSEEVKFNHQNGEGYYREVTYNDGGFRQYDTKSGELIGSSYDSDQDKLPSME